MNTKSMITASAVAIATALSAPAWSQDALPSSGDFTLRYTWVNPTTSEFGVVPRSDDPTAFAEAGGWIAWLMTADNSDGFGHKMTGKCVGMTRQAGGAFELVAGNCVYTDADGDQLFEEYDGLAGRWVGGTGKYSGITGTLDLTDIVITAESGYSVLSGVKVGSYVIQ